MLPSDGFETHLVLRGYVIRTDDLISLSACLPIVKLDINHQGGPIENIFIGTFDGSFRQEFLDENWLLAQRWYPVSLMYSALKVSHR